MFVDDGINMLRCIYIVLGVVSSFILDCFAIVPSQAEIDFALRVHNYLVEKSLIDDTRVGEALVEVIEGRASDESGIIPGNTPDANLMRQKNEISKHLRLHRHFGDDIALLKRGERFTKFPKYPSIFRISGAVNVETAEQISNDLIDLLLSTRTHIRIHDMQTESRANRFLLTADISKHGIKNLENIPCGYSYDPRINKKQQLHTFS